MKNIRRGVTKKVIGFLTMLFFSSTTLFAQAGPVLIHTPDAKSTSEIRVPEKISFPSELGTLQEFYRSADSERFVIYIQDAHNVIDAQKNMEKLITYFQKQLQIRLVAVEGTQENLDPLIFRTFPDEFVKKKILNHYAALGEFSGPELAAVFSPHPAVYSGLEDHEIYRENYQAYLQAVARLEKISTGLERKVQELDARRKEVYLPELNLYHEKTTAFLNEKEGLFELLKFLGSLGENSVDWASGRFTHLEPVFRAAVSEGASGAQDLDLRVRRLADSLKTRLQDQLPAAQMREFHEKYQSFVTSRIDGGTFLKFIVETAKQAGLRPKLSARMRELLGQTETLSMIKGTRLFDELETVLAEVEKNLVKTSGQKELASRYRALRLLRDLASLQWTREQLEEYRAAETSYREIMGELAEDFSPALDFYRAAVRRDGVFMDRLRRSMDREKTTGAIVLAGGFHSTGIEELLRAQKYSYAVITPQMDSLEGHERYAPVMQGDVSYKRFLGAGLYDAFVKDASLKMAQELSEPDFRRHMKQWRDALIRELAVQGRIEKSGQYTRYIDGLFAFYAGRYGLQGKLKTREEILEGVEDEVRKIGHETLEDLVAKFKIKSSEFVSGFKTLDASQKPDTAAVRELYAKVLSAVAPQRVLTPGAQEPWRGDVPVLSQASELRTDLATPPEIRFADLVNAGKDNLKTLLDRLNEFSTKVELKETDKLVFESFLRLFNYASAATVEGTQMDLEDLDEDEIKRGLNFIWKILKSFEESSMKYEAEDDEGQDTVGVAAQSLKMYLSKFMESLGIEVPNEKSTSPAETVGLGETVETPDPDDKSPSTPTLEPQRQPAAQANAQDPVLEQLGKLLKMNNMRANQKADNIAREASATLIEIRKIYQKIKKARPDETDVNVTLIVRKQKKTVALATALRDVKSLQGLKDIHDALKKELEKILIADARSEIQETYDLIKDLHPNKKVMVPIGEEKVSLDSLLKDQKLSSKKLNIILNFLIAMLIKDVEIAKRQEALDERDEEEFGFSGLKLARVGKGFGAKPKDEATLRRNTGKALKAAVDSSGVWGTRFLSYPVLILFILSSGTLFLNFIAPFSFLTSIISFWPAFFSIPAVVFMGAVLFLFLPAIDLLFFESGQIKGIYSSQELLTYHWSGGWIIPASAQQKTLDAVADKKDDQILSDGLYPFFASQIQQKKVARVVLREVKRVLDEAKVKPVVLSIFFAVVAISFVAGLISLAMVKFAFLTTFATGAIALVLFGVLVWYWQGAYIYYLLSGKVPTSLVNTLIEKTVTADDSEGQITLPDDEKVLAIIVNGEAFIPTEANTVERILASLGDPGATVTYVSRRSEARTEVAEEPGDLTRGPEDQDLSPIVISGLPLDVSGSPQVLPPTVQGRSELRVENVSEGSLPFLVLAPQDPEFLNAVLEVWGSENLREINAVLQNFSEDTLARVVRPAMEQFQNGINRYLKNAQTAEGADLALLVLSPEFESEVARLAEAFAGSVLNDENARDIFSDDLRQRFVQALQAFVVNTAVFGSRIQQAQADANIQVNAGSVSEFLSLAPEVLESRYQELRRANGGNLVIDGVQMPEKLFVSGDSESSPSYVLDSAFTTNQQIALRQILEGGQPVAVTYPLGTAAERQTLAFSKELPGLMRAIFSAVGVREGQPVDLSRLSRVNFTPESRKVLIGDVTRVRSASADGEIIVQTRESYGQLVGENFLSLMVKFLSTELVQQLPEIQQGDTRLRVLDDKHLSAFLSLVQKITTEFRTITATAKSA